MLEIANAAADSHGKSSEVSKNVSVAASFAHGEWQSCRDQKRLST
jgi:hypothetical protein